PGVTIINATSAVATVNNANASSGTLAFEVSVNDGTVTATGSTSIAVTAPPPPPAPPPTNTGGGGGGSPTTWLLMLLFAASLVRHKHLRRQQK
ncbi:MAG: hypothetical protein HKP09_06295, partial [Enterobacterales bacterium]|nr:hypothetical protein [Enterobacterales bacterium]